MWLVFFITGSVPELHTKPVELGMHVLAEITAAILLIVSGCGLLLLRQWGKQLNLISMGMLLYTLIMSPGYFLQQGEVLPAFMFFALLVLSVCVMALAFIKIER